jgi:hypothetical protein
VSQLSVRELTSYKDSTGVLLTQQINDCSDRIKIQANINTKIVGIEEINQ